MKNFRLTFHPDPKNHDSLPQESYMGIENTLGQCIAEAIAFGYTEAYVSDEDLITFFSKKKDDGSFATVEFIKPHVE